MHVLTYAYRRVYILLYISMYVSLFCCWALEQLLQCKSFFTLPKALPTSSTSFFISTLHSCCSGSGFPLSCSSGLAEATAAPWLMFQQLVLAVTWIVFKQSRLIPGRLGWTLSPPWTPFPPQTVTKVSCWWGVKAAEASQLQVCADWCVGPQRGVLNSPPHRSEHDLRHRRESKGHGASGETLASGTGGRSGWRGGSAKLPVRPPVRTRESPVRLLSAPVRPWESPGSPRETHRDPCELLWDPSEPQ